MATGVSASSGVVTYNFCRSYILVPKGPKPISLSVHSTYLLRKKRRFSLCLVMEKKGLEEAPPAKEIKLEEGEIKVKQALNGLKMEALSSRVAKKLARKQTERTTYLIAAIMSSLGITSMAALAVYYRFSWQMEGGEVPIFEMFGTFALSIGAAVSGNGVLDFWARWAHRALWHASLWHMHESHHRPRDGPFELNDVFAITNAVPAIALLSYGFFNSGFIPGLCFGAGLGITVFGMAYMFVHDGLVHRRFPVGPISNVPYLRRVAVAHQLHHSEKFNGVPYGLFLGPKELEEVGGAEELDKEIERRFKIRKSS